MHAAYNAGRSSDHAGVNLEAEDLSAGILWTLRSATEIAKLGSKWPVRPEQECRLIYLCASSLACRQFSCVQLLSVTRGPGSHWQCAGQVPGSPWRHLLIGTGKLE